MDHEHFVVPWAFTITSESISHLAVISIHLRAGSRVSSYGRSLLSGIIGVLWFGVSDTFHKPGFKLHARILHHLFSIVLEGSVIRAPLWDTQAKGPNAYSSNAEYARDAVTELLCNSFPNMQKPQVEVG